MNKFNKIKKKKKHYASLGKIIETEYEEIVYLDILPALSKISSHCGYS